MKATIYKSDGTKQAVTPANGFDFSLEELQAIVGGYIEVFSLDEFGSLMVVNEEGKLNGLPFNAEATRLIGEAGIVGHIVGDALVCESEMIK